MASNISLDAATLLALVLESVAYGFSTLMFIGTVWALTYKQHMQDVSRPIAVVAILLLILSTVHIVVNTIRVEDGLVKYRNTFPGGPVAFFADLTQQTVVIKNVVYVLQTLLADGVVIYRCYVVWRSVSVIILPSVLWCSVAVTGFYATYSFLQVTSNSRDIYVNEYGQPAQWVTAFFSLTIATNLLSSGLLAYRIWVIEHDVSTIRAKKDTMMPIVRVLMDSAILYSVALLTALICYVCSNDGEVTIADMIVPIISIAFYMVLIRIAINRRHHSHSSTIGMTNQHPMQYLQAQLMRNDGTADSVGAIGNKDGPSTFKAKSRKGSLEL
ncbi:hypothetical protein CY34DRAFT_798080 [Suillus luteus UH-Slu-Lm8-n1]|uniref:Uncharacterized protein n=1 Tax=Suillus luteus UH-Slu-Lm8-n1 TaxID=930992 RepID=A0A0D0BFW3_9AGAM|nr:hypothetical protein CY34DRAFT_798080 [Suillus luteus UH-Slu-Lm8-n1]